MYRIALVNMPFASLQRPSIALMQLKAVVQQQHGGKVTVDVHHINQEFGRELGIGSYLRIAESIWATSNGFGDWFFRAEAFPQEPDNVEDYWHRFFAGRRQQDPESELLLRKRASLRGFLDDLIDRYRLADYDLVGFTSMFSQNLASFAMARRLKRRNPGMVIVMGGANCEVPMGQEIVKNVDCVDFVFSGPALKNFPEFVGHRLSESGSKCSEIRGVLCRSNLAQRSSPAELMGEETDINMNMSLDHEDFIRVLRESFPENNLRPILMFETSRGCWWGQRAHCTFCGLNGSTMAYRAMTPSGAIALMNDLFRYSGSYTQFDAVDNIMPREYLTEVFPYLKTPPNISIFYEVKADLKYSDLETLARVRVTTIQPGIESLDSSVLKLMKKGTTSFQNVTFLRNCLATGIHPVWNLLIGFPGESESVYRKYATHLPQLLHFPPPTGIFPIRFDRFSPYFTRAAEYGLELMPSDFYEYVYPFDEESRRNIAYYFVDTNYASDYIGVMSEWKVKLDPLVESWCARWRGPAKSRPKLELLSMNGAAFICDSRGDEAVNYGLSSDESRLLAYLESPRKPADMARDCDLSVEAVASVLDRLCRARLLWREDDRYLSLVVARPEVEGLQSSQ